MAKVTIPQRGQPLDVSYIYTLAQAINDLSQQVSSAKPKNSTIDTVNIGGKQNVNTSDVKIVAGYNLVANNSTVTAGNEFPFSVTFDSAFKYTPIVTASPVNVGGTPAGQNLSVVVTSITASSVTGVVRFNASGNLSVAVHVIAVGIPN